jgi:excisionase family DNA binding protein
MQLISVSEAARRAGVRREAIYYSIRAGKINAHRESGAVLVEAEQVDRYNPRASSSRAPKQRHVTGRGRFADVLSSVDDFIARKAEEKALER